MFAPELSLPPAGVPRRRPQYGRTETVRREGKIPLFRVGESRVRIYGETVLPGLQPGLPADHGFILPTACGSLRHRSGCCRIYPDEIGIGIDHRS